MPVLLEDIEVTVYQGGTYGTTNVISTIYQDYTGSSQGPSPNAGATGGPNPFFTGSSGLVEFWVDTGFYDVVISDTHVPARIPDRVINYNSMPVDAELTSIAGLTSAADTLPYYTGAGTASLATFTSAGRALVDDASASAQRTTLSTPGFITCASDQTAVVGTGFADAASSLNLSVTSGVTTKFQYYIRWTANATTTGGRFSLNGPATTALAYTVRYNTTASVWTLSSLLRLYDATTGNTVGTDSNADGNLAILEGYITPSSSGTLALRSSAEVASPGSITVKAGSSVLSWT